MKLCELSIAVLLCATPAASAQTSLDRKPTRGERAKKAEEAARAHAALRANQTRVDAEAAKAHKQLHDLLVPHGAGTIYGTVVQRIEGGGLLVSCDQGRTGMTARVNFGGKHVDMMYEYAPNPAKEGAFVLLKNHPEAATLVDDDRVAVVGFMTGTHQYTTPLGTMKTVRVYDCIPPKK